MPIIVLSSQNIETPVSSFVIPITIVNIQSFSTVGISSDIECVFVVSTPFSFTEACSVMSDLLTVSCQPENGWWSWSSDPSVTQTIYLFTLTGAPDGQSDIIIPISSAQGRLRDGDPTYLSVVIPSSTYSEAISLRPNGEMVLQRGVRLSDGALQLEEIARVTLEDIRIDEGARNQSISLSGHATVTNSTPKTVQLTGASYRNIINGSTRYRCALNNFLRPGDTAEINGESLLVNSITYTIGVSSETMEIAEA